MTSVAPVSGPAQLGRAFNDLALDMARKDGDLQRLQNGGSYPAMSWSQWFQDTATSFDNARVELIKNKADLPPEAARSLQQAVLSLSRDSGQLLDMTKHQHTFGQGWGQALDRPINIARKAADFLQKPPSAPKEPVKAPVPMPISA